MSGVAPADSNNGPLRPDTPEGNKESKGSSFSSTTNKATNVGGSRAGSSIPKRSSAPLVLGAGGEVMAQATVVTRLPIVQQLSAGTSATPPVTIDYADAHKLLAHSGDRRDDGVVSMHEWEINFALLHSAYKKTNDPIIHQKIRFLMNNYLQKTAYFNTRPKYVSDDQVMQGYAEMLQYGQMTYGGMYHRTADSMIHHLIMMGYEGRLGDSKSRVENMVPLETMDITHLYSLKFESQEGFGATGSAASLMVQQFEGNKASPPAAMSTPALIDVSDVLGSYIFTDRDPSKISEYQKKRAEVRERVLQEVDLAVAELRGKHPELKMSDDELQAYILMNTAVVTRGVIDEDLSVLSFCGDLFDNSDFKVDKMGDGKGESVSFSNYYRNKQLNMQKLYPLSNYAGLGLGAVSFRMEVAKSVQDPQGLVRSHGGREVTWASGSQSRTMMYKTPGAIIGSGAMRGMKEIAAKKDVYGRAQALLAQGTSKMIDSLFLAIPQATWDRVQEDPAALDVVQVAVMRMMHHIGDANIHTKDFRKFSQAIERVHAELATILFFMQPFPAGTFEREYGKYIQEIMPGGMSPAVLGVGKSAMNIYCGVNAALKEDNPAPVRVFGEHTYYEETGLFGHTPIHDVLEDPSVEKVDMFTCEFYHNINPEQHEIRYYRENIIHDIKEIFHRKPDTDALTVVIDATIDMTKSEDMKELFEEFSEEIEEGRINFVVVRSGQKYDMLGLDHYFGAPFYLVNNGDPKWAKMNAVKGQSAHQTDGLSEQYFHWMAATGPQVMDDYKARIYKNTREILNQVPSGLKPERGRSVMISEMDEGVATPFFEITYQMNDPRKDQELAMWLHENFAKMFVEEGKLFYARGSFGFAHPNFTMIDDKIRINPGLDPSETTIYRNFFLALEAKVQELEARS